MKKWEREKLNREMREIARPKLYPYMITKEEAMWLLDHAEYVWSAKKPREVINSHDAFILAGMGCPVFFRLTPVTNYLSLATTREGMRILRTLSACRGAR